MHMNIKELSVELFSLITHTEILQDSQNVNLTNILKEVSMIEDPDHHCENELSHKFLKFKLNVKDTLYEMFPTIECCYVIYFLPGTREDISLYFFLNRWQENWSPNKTGIKWAESRNQQISKDLRLNEVKGIKDNFKNEHMFHCVYMHSKKYADLLYNDVEIRPINNHIDPNFFFHRYSLYANPLHVSELKYEYKYDEGGQTKQGKISWDRNNSEQSTALNPVIVSPVFVNENTLVTMTSFFNSEFNSKTIEKKQAIMEEHNMFANTIFTPFYGALLRSDFAILRQNLSRTQVSSCLLNYSAEKLRYEDFTYYWKKELDERIDGDTIYWNCSDLLAKIHHDIIQHPDNVFETIIKIEKKIYDNLRKEWNTFIQLKSNFKLPLTRNLPFPNLLEGMEKLQRTLKMSGRDHIIHQFQVFLYGNLLISHFEDKFVSSIISEAQNLGFTNVSDILAKYLLKISWFFTSIFHDVGYPIELIDNLNNEMRTEANKLLGFDVDNRKIDNNHKLGIDKLFYDDPRCFKMIQDFSSIITEKITKEQDLAKINKKELNNALFWFFKQYLFVKKHHSIVSCVVVGLKFLGSNSKFSRKNFVSHFLYNNILIPILLHHSNKWGNIDIKEFFSNYKKCFKNKFDHVEKYRTIICKYFESDRRADYKQLIKFNESPISALLCLCDTVQEWGRPAGRSKPNWPDPPQETLHYLENDYFALELNFKYKNENDSDSQIDFSAKHKDLEFYYELFDLGELDKVTTIMKSNLHQKNHEVIPNIHRDIDAIKTILQ